MTEDEMRADLMGWVQRLVAMVFVIGLVALVAAITTLVRQAEGVPPLPIYAGLVGAVALILLAGACLALISIAVSARRGADALRRMAAQGGVAAPVAAPARPFSSSPIREAAKEPEPEPDAITAPSRPSRPEGKRLVAQR
ncbi:hypothetical protein [Paracoccus methylarcula]|uniref:Uncharacterized protein n=1 Tax=Paracoccus methylarcula TaxID=72022 RepID=A0A422R1D0_9RHOB|nr:hypothetical protein [Paracoccus methylarcula]RNF35981.1 hypothetical protein A7A09_000790 [Paracoccus methylarcula]